MPKGEPTARTRANRKYNEKAYDKVLLYFKGGEKSAVAHAAAQLNMSTNAFINSVLMDKLQAMGIDPQDFIKPDDYIPSTQIPERP